MPPAPATAIDNLHVDRPAVADVAPDELRYYDFRRRWTKKILPHLGGKKLNDILVRDFNRLTYGCWRKHFRQGDLPCQFENCDWRLGHRGRYPRYWAYVKHAACHFLVNFNLRLATLAEPRRPWRIITSDKHSSVWDGDATLFDMNFSALGVPSAECFALAYDRELRPGQYRRTGWARYWREEVAERARSVALAN